MQVITQVVGAVHGVAGGDGLGPAVLRDGPGLPLTCARLLLLWQHGQGRGLDVTTLNLYYVVFFFFLHL